MVNRVFCYSVNEAKRNGVYLSVGKLIFQIFGLIILMVIIIFASTFISGKFNELIFPLTFLCTIALVLYAVFAGIKFRSQLIAFASNNNGNLYQVTKLNNGEEFAIGGLAAGGIIDIISENNDSLLGDAASVAGSAIALYKMNNSAKIMRNPDIVAKIIDNASTTTGAIVWQILKVHSISVMKNKVKVNCDYKILGSNKIKYNKNITIFKAYNCFDDLLSLFKNRS